MGGQNRNTPCWCGSGKKYKKCHMNRTSQASAPDWSLREGFRNIYDTKVCLHPTAGKNDCSKNIVRAHTVRRSADLKAIARNGHVYQGSTDPRVLAQSGGKVIPALIGINNASTFWGFCQIHDCMAFAPLEQKAFGPTDEQAFLLAYRPLVKELYLKKRLIESNEMLRDADKGKSLMYQLDLQDFINAYNAGAMSALADLEHHKAIFDNRLLDKDYTGVRYVAIQFDRPPDIMSSGALQPAYTFQGKQIQNLSDINSTLEQVGFSLLATESGGAAVFSWLDNSNTASSVLVDSLLSLPENEIPSALVRYALSELENCFLRPEWWESLDSQTTRVLVGRLNHNVDPFQPHESTHLLDDGIRPVQWRVTGVDQKRS